VYFTISFIVYQVFNAAIDAKMQERSRVIPHHVFSPYVDGAFKQVALQYCGGPLTKFGRLLAIHAIADGKG
jgi:hypothetical protein